MPRTKQTRRIRRKKLRRTRYQRGGSGNNNENENIENVSLQVDDIMLQEAYNRALLKFPVFIARRLVDRGGNAPDRDDIIQRAEMIFGGYLTNYVYTLAKWVAENPPGACLSMDMYRNLGLSNIQRLIEVLINSLGEPGRTSMENLLFNMRRRSIHRAVFNDETGEYCRLSAPFIMDMIKFDPRFIGSDGRPLRVRLSATA